MNRGTPGRVTPRSTGLALVLASALLCVGAAAASAQETWQGCLDRGGSPSFGEGGDVTCHVSDGNGDPSEDGSETTDTWEPPDGYVLIEYGVGTLDDDGDRCIERGSDWVPEEEATNLQSSRSLALFFFLEQASADGQNEVPDCPFEPDEQTPSPAMVRDVIEGQLPLPEPALQPSERTLPGLRTYLEIGAPTSWSADLEGTAIPVTLSVSGEAEYRVDWGDGTVETYDSAGGPYPDGDVTHVYADAGEVTVTVTPIWTVTWSVGGSAPMTLPPIPLVDSTLELPVTEIRSVRTD